MQISSDYFREYRLKLGFSRQDEAKKFLQAKDIPAGVDLKYIEKLNSRLQQIIIKLNSIVHNSIKRDHIDLFCEKTILNNFYTLKDNDILPRLNNQGRRVEQVYFSWMRGYTLCEYFKPLIATFFGVNELDISISGDDNLNDISNFKRTPSADLQFFSTTLNSTVRVDWFHWHK